MTAPQASKTRQRRRQTKQLGISSKEQEAARFVHDQKKRLLFLKKTAERLKLKPITENCYVATALDKESMFTDLCEETNFRVDHYVPLGRNASTDVINEEAQEQDEEGYFERPQIRKKTQSMKHARPERPMSNTLNIPFEQIVEA